MGTSALLYRTAVRVLARTRRGTLVACQLIHDHGLLWKGRPCNLEGLTENPVTRRGRMGQHSERDRGRVFRNTLCLNKHCRQVLTQRSVHPPCR